MYFVLEETVRKDDGEDSILLPLCYINPFLPAENHM